MRESKKGYPLVTSSKPSNGLSKIIYDNSCHSTLTICKKWYIPNIPLKKSLDKLLDKDLSKTLALYVNRMKPHK